MIEKPIHHLEADARISQLTGSHPDPETHSSFSFIAITHRLPRVSMSDMRYHLETHDGETKLSKAQTDPDRLKPNQISYRNP
jgi:hypothetical protein